MGILYIVSTPIGNLKDITLRAIETLTHIDYIACEDTRRTGNLLNVLYSSSEALLSREVITEDSSRPIRQTQGRQARTIKAKLISYYEQNELQRIPEIVAILQNGSDVALVSDAGTPTISDPGFKLVRECITQGIKVESIPGPSSVITALTLSGLPTDKFLFLGYPHKKEGHRKDLFKALKTIYSSSEGATATKSRSFSSRQARTIKVTIIFFEAPHRLTRTLEELKEVLGDIDIVICRELTKIHEEVRREKISASIAHFQKVNPKGEFVILFHPDTI